MADLCRLSKVGEEDKSVLPNLAEKDANEILLCDRLLSARQEDQQGKEMKKQLEEARTSQCSAAQ